MHMLVAGPNLETAKSLLLDPSQQIHTSITLRNVPDTTANRESLVSVSSQPRNLSELTPCSTLCVRSLSYCHQDLVASCSSARSDPRRFVITGSQPSGSSTTFLLTIKPAFTLSALHCM